MTVYAEAVAEIRRNRLHAKEVAREYEITKADHARDEGCDLCTHGLDPARSSGWKFIKDDAVQPWRPGLPGTLICPACVQRQKNLLATRAWRQRQLRAAARDDA